jgi:hypothetical protein
MQTIIIRYIFLSVSFKLINSNRNEKDFDCSCKILPR